ncbi:MAG: sulfatase, partial [Armatimonadota bacterium]
QQSAHMMSCTGNPWLRTPAMDSLAATGTRFESAYVTNPVCLPARFSFLTGKYPSAIGVRHNGSKPTPLVSEMPRRSLGWILRDAGYETAYGGKVHLPGPMGKIEDCGFTNLTGDSRAPLADACATFLKARHDKPFLLVASFINPHDICYMAIRDQSPDNALAKRVPPPLFEAMKLPAGVSEDEFYQRHCPPLPPNHEPTDGEPDGIRQLLNMRQFRLRARQNWGEREWRLHRWAYCRLTELVDAHIAKVLQALRQSGIGENTIVIFTSDHGDMDSAHKLEHKTVFYEEAARVPMIISHKGHTPPGRVDDTHLVSNGLDLIPTLCDYAGAEPPDDLQGVSVRPLAEGREPESWRKDLWLEDQVGFMVHTGRHKYQLYDEGEPREMLTDLESDPGEMKNLASDPRHAPVLTDLRRRLAQHARENGVEVRLPGD